MRHMKSSGLFSIYILLVHIREAKPKELFCSVSQILIYKYIQHFICKIHVSEAYF